MKFHAPVALIEFKWFSFKNYPPQFQRISLNQVLCCCDAEETPKKQSSLALIRITASFRRLYFAKVKVAHQNFKFTFKSSNVITCQ